MLCVTFAPRLCLALKYFEIVLGLPYALDLVFFSMTAIGLTFLLREFVVVKIPDTKSFSYTVSWVLVSILVVSYVVLRHAREYQISLSI